MMYFEKNFNMRYFLVFVITPNALPLQIGVLKMNSALFPTQAAINNLLLQQNAAGMVVTGITEVTQAEMNAY